MGSKAVSQQDLAIGDVIQFYDSGWRFGVVTKIQKKVRRKTKKEEWIIHTDRYGKVLLEKVSDVYEYVDGKTVPKKLLSELFD